MTEVPHGPTTRTPSRCSPPATPPSPPRRAAPARPTASVGARRAGPHHRPAAARAAGSGASGCWPTAPCATPSCRWPASSAAPSATRPAPRSAGWATSSAGGPARRRTRRSPGWSSRSGRRLAFVGAAAIDTIQHNGIVLSSARLDLVDFAPRPGEVTLFDQVLDHQLVDVDGVQVIRAADLYLAPVYGRYSLVGVDISAQSLLRRLGPARWRHHPTPDRVIDWGAIQPFGDTAQGAAPEVRLRTTNEGLERLRPGELADLLEDLMRPERQKLLDSLTPEEAADALEEMDPEELASLLREAEPARAAELLGRHGAGRGRRRPARPLERRARRDPGRHGPGQGDRPAPPARLQRARGRRLHDHGVPGGADHRDGGRRWPPGWPATRTAPRSSTPWPWSTTRAGWSGTCPCCSCWSTPGDTVLADLVGEAEPVTVGIHAQVAEVAERLIDARRMSVVVVDEEDRPVGRILADDVIDALMPERGRIHFPRLLQ